MVPRRGAPRPCSATGDSSWRASARSRATRPRPSKRAQHRTRRGARLARATSPLDRASDATVVERALNAYLLGRLLDAAEETAGLAEQDAERIAYEELQSARRARGDA